MMTVSGIRICNCFESNCQLTNPTPDFACIDSGKAKLQAFPFHLAAVVPAQRDGIHMTLRRGPCGRSTVDATAQQSRGLQSGLHACNLQLSRKMFTRALQQNRQTLRIDFSHAAEMPSEMPFRNEIA